MKYRLARLRAPAPRGGSLRARDPAVRGGRRGRGRLGRGPGGDGAGMRVRGWLAVLLLAPVLALTAGLYVVPLGVYLVNGFYRFKDGRILRVWTLDTYAAFLTDAFSYKIVSTSLLLAGIVTALALLDRLSLGLRPPHAGAERPGPRRPRGGPLLPLMISVVVRTYGWLILLANQGLVNTTLLRLGLIERARPPPLQHAGRGDQPDAHPAAVRDLSDLQRAGEARPLAQGGGARPRRRPVGDVLARDAAAHAPRAWSPAA